MIDLNALVNDFARGQRLAIQLSRQQSGLCDSCSLWSANLRRHEGEPDLLCARCMENCRECQHHPDNQGHSASCSQHPDNIRDAVEYCTLHGKPNCGKCNAADMAFTLEEC